MYKSPIASWNRRRFLKSLSATGAFGLAGLKTGIAAADPPPETTSLTILQDPQFPVLCYGPQYVATEMLKLEGFKEIKYVPYDPDLGVFDARVLAAADADITTAWVQDILSTVEDGGPVVALSGMHVGCTEIFARKGIRSIRDLKGKRFALSTPTGSAEHDWLSILFTYIGLDPDRDIEWVEKPYEEWGDLLAAGEIDAVMLWPPDAQVFRNQKIGHVILDTGTDKPWRDYYCCAIAGNTDFVQRNPVATKRAIRAILKATDLCAQDPETAASIVTANGFPTEYETALQVFSEVPYALWRDVDPEDTLRFYALRMHKLGLIETPPEELVTKASDWRFLRELKRELKA
jgi:NitT/TauT family transport system substrate-binding protein